MRPPTCCASPGRPTSEPVKRLLRCSRCPHAGTLETCARLTRRQFTIAGYEVQTTRIATPSYRFWTPPGPDALLDIIDFERLVLDAGVSFVSVGHAPVTPQLRHEVCGMKDGCAQCNIQHFSHGSEDSNECICRQVPAMLSATSIVSCSAFLGPVMSSLIASPGVPLAYSLQGQLFVNAWMRC